MLGDFAVGKTSLLCGCMSKEFSAEHKETLGVDYAERSNINSEDGKKLTLKIWELADHANLHMDVLKQYYKNAAGALIVYDVARRETFDDVTFYLK